MRSGQQGTSTRGARLMPLRARTNHNIDSRYLQWWAQGSGADCCYGGLLTTAYSRMVSRGIRSPTATILLRRLARHKVDTMPLLLGLALVRSTPIVAEERRNQYTFSVWSPEVLRYDTEMA